MIRVSRHRLILGAAIAVLALAGCGPIDDDSEPQPVAGGPVDIKLTVSADLGGGFTRQGTLECGNRPLGSGFLGGSGKATEACKLMALSGDARKRLLLGPERDRVCTEEYGGPQTATISGVIDKQAISTAVDRANGCGIADWDLLEPLIGPPDA